jgi:hypothetical protein
MYWYWLQIKWDKQIFFCPSGLSFDFLIRLSHSPDDYRLVRMIHPKLLRISREDLLYLQKEVPQSVHLTAGGDDVTITTAALRLPSGEVWSTRSNLGPYGHGA